MSRCRQAETPPDQHLLVERDGHVLVVTMNRPERRNALSPSMMEGMADGVGRGQRQPRHPRRDPHRRRRLLLRRADLEAMTEPPRPATRSSGATSRVSDIAKGVIKPLLKGFLLDKPLIAAVEGPAVAGGTEILQGTDIRIAGESARFGVSEVRWGLYPLGGSVVRLRRQIPYAVAADILLTGPPRRARPRRRRSA